MSEATPRRAGVGLTKIAPGLKAGDILDTTLASMHIQIPPSDWDFPRVFLQPDPSPHNNQRSNAADGKSISPFASARVDEAARKVNWRLIGKDAPWLYVETIFRKQDQKPWFKAELRTSIDVVLGADEQHPFNDLNFFQRDYNNDKNPYSRIKVLGMDGHLGEFLESGSSTWPGPGLLPKS